MNMQTLRGMQSAKLKRDLDLKSGNATYCHETDFGEKEGKDVGREEGPGLTNGEKFEEHGP